jgi:hypothetical protein
VDLDEANTERSEKKVAELLSKDREMQVGPCGAVGRSAPGHPERSAAAASVAHRPVLTCGTRRFTRRVLYLTVAAAA